MNTGMILSKKNPFLKRNAEISGYGLKKVIEHLPNTLLPRRARVILSQICEIAASSSEYKIFKSKSRMSQEAGVTPATIRRNLDLAIDAGIITKTYIFDPAKGQRPTEYQFTSNFIKLAKQVCLELVKCHKGSLENVLKSLFSSFSPKFPPDQNDQPAPGQNDLQSVEVLSFYSQKKKDIPPAEAVGNVFIKSAKTATAERASTKARDYAERQERLRDERKAEQVRVDNLIKRRSFISGRHAVSPQSGFNSPRYLSENKKADDAWTSANNSFKQALAAGMNPLEKIAMLRNLF